LTANYLQSLFRLFFSACALPFDTAKHSCRVNTHYRYSRGCKKQARRQRATRIAGWQTEVLPENATPDAIRAKRGVFCTRSAQRQVVSCGPFRVGLETNVFTISKLELPDNVMKLMTPRAALGTFRAILEHGGLGHDDNPAHEIKRLASNPKSFCCQSQHNSRHCSRPCKAAVLAKPVTARIWPASWLLAAAVFPRRAG